MVRASCISFLEFSLVSIDLPNPSRRTRAGKQPCGVSTRIAERAYGAFARELETSDAPTADLGRDLRVRIAVSNHAETRVRRGTPGN